jgi:hypothetical protein
LSNKVCKDMALLMSSYIPDPRNTLCQNGVLFLEYFQVKDSKFQNIEQKDEE